MSDREEPRRRRRKRRRSWPRTILLLVFVAAALVGVYKCVVHPPQREDPDPALSSQGAASSEDRLSAEELARQQALAAHTRRKDQFYTILISGIDDGNGNCDTNILLAVDVPGGSIRGVSIPRDTKIVLNGKSRKFNYAYGSGGMELVAETLSDQLGIPVDFTVEVGLKAFVELVDAVGGVDFEVPVNMDYEDPLQDLSIHYTKGMHHLTGKQALEVVRFRSGYASQDLGRINTQQAFLKALAKQLLQPGNLGKVNDFAKIFQTYVKTDLEIGELAWLGQQAVSMGGDSISFSTLPGEWHDPYIYLDADEVLALVNEHLNPYEEDRTAADLNIPGRG